MAIPALQSLESCADFSQAVQPYIPQLYALPGRLWENGLDAEGLLELYAETNPLASGFAFALFAGAVFFVVAEANRNYSQVDRMWSILPAMYNLHYALWARAAGVEHARVDLVALFSAVWSCRLTFNYWRKGGYSIGSEDYRWEIIKGYVHPIVFTIFDLTFIAFYQSLLIFLFSSAPTYTILLAQQFEPSITAADAAYFAVQMALVLSEWFSDGQQWEYQMAKRRYQKDAKLPKGFNQDDLNRGFITTGMFAYSRHPNFCAEQAIWFVLYQWGCFATNVLYSWTFVGSASLMLLFQGSTWLTEAITASKYPEYDSYQKQVGMFFPTSLRPYKGQAATPKVIRTSELAKRQEQKQKETKKKK